MHPRCLHCVVIGMKLQRVVCGMQFVICDVMSASVVDPTHEPSSCLPLCVDVAGRNPTSHQESICIHYVQCRLSLKGSFPVKASGVACKAKLSTAEQCGQTCTSVCCSGGNLAACMLSFEWLGRLEVGFIKVTSTTCAVHTPVHVLCANSSLFLAPSRAWRTPLLPGTSCNLCANVLLLSHPALICFATSLFQLPDHA